MKKTAIIYTRVSTAQQADDELPLQSQLDRCIKKAGQLGVQLLHTFSDAGKSGRADDRVEFQAAIRYCEKHKVDYFITWSTSRFTRNTFDAAVYKRKLDDRGTELVYVSCEMDRDTMSGFMMEKVMEIFDEAYSRQISEDTQRSMRMNAESGYWNGGNTPLGYEPVVAEDNQKRKRLAIKEDEAEIVREIFKLRIDGYGALNISQILNNQEKTRRGNRWSKSAVLALLRNPTVIGCTQYGKKDRRTGKKSPPETWTLVNSHEPIINADTWQSVQSIMNACVTNPTGLAGSPRSKWLFTGLMTCAKCGASMQIETAKKGKYSYYNCRNHQKHKTCERNAFRADHLDPFLVDTISTKIFTEKNLRQIIRDMHEYAGRWLKIRGEAVKVKVREIEKLERAIDRIMTTIETVQMQGADAGMLVARMNQHQEKIHNLEEEILEIEDQAPPKILITEKGTAQLSQFLRTVMLEAKNPTRIRGFFSSFISDVKVGKKAITIYYQPDRIIAQEQGVVAGGQVPSEVVWLPGPGSNQGPND